MHIRIAHRLITAQAFADWPKKWLKKSSALLTVILFSLLLRYGSAAGEVNTGYIDLVTRLEVDRLGISHPSSLTSDPNSGALLLLESGKNRVYAISTFGELLATETLEGVPDGVQHIEYDARSDGLLMFDPSRQQLQAASGEKSTAVTLPQLTVNGIASDPTSGDVYLLDSGSGQFIRVAASGFGLPDPAVPPGSAAVSTIALGGETSDLRGLAFDRATRHLFSIHPKRQQLLEFTLAGDQVKVYDLSLYNLSEPGALSFAPSNDQTDEPSASSLYIAGGGMEGDVWEFTFTPEVAYSMTATAATLVQTINVWQFSPPSPDASGATYLPDSGTLLQTDSEVNEKAIYQDANQFKMTLRGALINTYDTTHFSEEPTGIAYDPDRNHLFISDDNRRMVYESDRSYNMVNSFSVATLDGKLVDPEGIAYDSWNGRLYIAGGASDMIFWIDPGNDNNFGTNDDLEGSFPATNLSDPEGITFNTDNGNLFGVGRFDVVAEYTPAGSVVQMIDISAADARKPAGLAFGPTSVGGGKSIYVTDRGYDLDSDINGGKGDGRIYEFALGTLPAPTADFVGSPTSGPVALTVNFSNSSSGFYETCLWSFGNGGSSTDCVNPSHEYANPGTYEVSLTVSGSSGESTAVKTGYIVASGPMTADFSGKPSGGITPLQVAFTNLATGDYDTCLWDFGDGSTSTDCANPQHIYTVAGNYTVSLIVSGAGGSQTATKVDYIMVSEAGNANFSADPQQGIAPLSVNFTNLSLGDFDSCQWDFGDGNTLQSCSDPAHTYTTPGTYSVTLTIDGSDGPDSVTFTNLISIYEAVAANFDTDPREGIEPVTVNFSNLSSGDYLTCLWDFGDGGSSSYCDNPSYLYTKAGTYTVSLRVEGPGGIDSKIVAGSINVKAATASFSSTPTVGKVPLVVFFDNLSEGTYDTCLWDFGDGETSSDCDNPSHAYKAPGSYTVTLSMNGPSGANSMRKIEYISAEPNLAIFPLILQS